MKIVFICLASLGLGLASSPARAGQGPLERVAALVAYVAADYPGAVKDGRVLAQAEYEEQRSLIGEARRLAGGLRPSPGRQEGPGRLQAELAVLAGRVEARAGESEVAAAARAITRRLVDDYGLVLAPIAPPSEERARSLYASSCAECHGADGRADTEKARTLQPRPVSFFDAERMSRISPSLAFHALTFGVGDTAMAAFDTLPTSDRWSLAFWVVSLRHRATPIGQAALPFSGAGAPIAPTASRLADLSDAQLDQALRSRLPAPGPRAAAIAWLRAVAPFAPPAGGPFAEARRRLAELGGLAAADPVDRSRARDVAIAAYLEGIEPHEASLRARDRALADRLEGAFIALRRAVDGGGDAETIRREVARAALALDHVEEQAEGGASVAFLAAFAIALREGFELSLLIAALLAFVRRAGRPEHARFVHWGWLAAIPAGLATWFAIGAALGGARRELTEGVLTLVAAGMLLFVSHFVLGRLESRRWLKFLERRTMAVEGAAGTSGPRPWPLVTLAFFAAYREAIEVVLFFRALVLDSPGGALAITGGIVAALALLGAAVTVMSRLGRRLDPRPVMTASSVVLTVLAISLVGQGIRALQEGGFLAFTPYSLPSLPVLGLYPTREGMLVQAVVLALAVVPSWIARRRQGAARAARAA